MGRVAVAREIDAAEERAEALVGLAARENAGALVGEALELVQSLKGRQRAELLARLAGTGDPRVVDKLKDWLYRISYHSDSDFLDNAGLILDVLALSPEPFRAREIGRVTSKLDNRHSWFRPRDSKVGELLRVA